MPNEEIQNEKVETEETSEPTDKREGILDYIKSAWKGTDETDTSDNEGKEEKVPTDSEEDFERTEDTPVDFVEAAKADGWNAKDIENFAADKTDEELLELLPSLTEEKEEEEVNDTTVNTTKQDAEEPAKEEVKDLEALKSSMKAELLKEVLSELGPKFESLDDFKVEQASRQVTDDFETANQILDGASKDFPTLGEFENMPKFTTGSRKGQLVPTGPEFKARAEVFNLAVDLMEAGRSKSIENAMDDALAWYRGKYGQKQTERKVIRNLKAHEKKLSGARTGKETKREYETSRDEILDFIRQEKKTLGQ